jgi:CNT family concentrative nucleoside transporter
VWFFILLILLHNSKYIPQRPFVVVLVKIWSVVAVPWSKLPHIGKLALGWFALAILVFGTTYGLPVTPTSGYVDRTRSLAGLVIIYLAQFARSHNHKAIQARTAILGIGFQFIIALFVFRTGAGYSLFGWIATAAADLLTQAQVGGAAFFWSSAFIKNYYFMVNTLSSIIFFVALSVALFYCGILSWVIRKFAWFFYKTFGISGAEAVVAVASPFIGQGENVILIKPFALGFSRSEFHQVLTSGFATISGSLLNTYIYLGVPGTVLVSSSVMSIPAAIAASKMVYPETQEVESAGTVSVTSAEQMQDGSSGTLHAFSKGAWFGVKVAGLIFANVLVLLSLVYVINGILAYIGNAWYITDANRGPLSLELIIGYVLWPLTYMLGVPKVDVLRVSKLIATKIVANEVSE